MIWVERSVPVSLARLSKNEFWQNEKLRWRRLLSDGEKQKNHVSSQAKGLYEI
jgi:hypothetical protein